MGRPRTRPQTGFTAGPPLTEKDAKEVAEMLELKLGTSAFPFAGNYRIKGLYSYNTGPLQNVAFFGQGGSDLDKTKALDSPRFRPKLIVAEDPDDAYPADPDDAYPADPDDEYPADRKKEEPKPLPADQEKEEPGPKVQRYHGLGAAADTIPIRELDLLVKTIEGGTSHHGFKSNKTIRELQQEMVLKYGVQPNKLELILDENDPRDEGTVVFRRPFLTRVGEAFDRRGAPADAGSISVKVKWTEGYSESETSGEGGGSSKSFGITGSFGTGSLIPLKIKMEAGGKKTSSTSWSLSRSTTVIGSRSVSETYQYPPGVLCEVYAWAIMIPDGNNDDKVFILPTDDENLPFVNGLYRGKTVAQHDEAQEKRAVIEIVSKQKKITHAGLGMEIGVSFGFSNDVPKVPAKPKPKWFRLRNGHGNYLSCPGNVIRTDKTLYVDRHYPNQNGQLWCEEKVVGDGGSSRGVLTRIRSKLEKKGKPYYLAVYTGSTKSGTEIGVWGYGSSRHQGWTIGEGLGDITHERSGKVLSTSQNASYPGHVKTILYHKLSKPGRPRLGQKWERVYQE